MEIITRIFIGEEKQAKIEPTAGGFIILYPVPKNNLIALLNGDVKGLDLE